MCWNKGLDYSLARCISDKSLLTWKPLFTSKFDTAANKQCYIYILISGTAFGAGDEFKCVALRREPQCRLAGRLSSRPRQNNEKWLRPEGHQKPSHCTRNRFYYRASVNIQYLSTDCVSYKSICKVTTSAANICKAQISTWLSAIQRCSVRTHTRSDGCHLAAGGNDLFKSYKGYYSYASVSYGAHGCRAHEHMCCLCSGGFSTVNTYV